jgi:hypothetical protein
MGFSVLAAVGPSGVIMGFCHSLLDHTHQSSPRLSLTEPDLANYARGAPVQIIEFARFTHLQIDNPFVP